MLTMNSLQLQIQNLEHILCDTRHELYQRKLFMAEAKDWVNEVKTDLRHCTNNVSDVNSGN